MPSKAKNAIVAGLFADKRDGGIGAEGGADFITLPSVSQCIIIDPKTSADWKLAKARWYDGSGFREYVIDYARREVAAKRHFNLGYILENARRCVYLGRDDSDYRSNNNLRAAFARLLLHDLPDAAPYIELRRSRFDMCCRSGAVFIEQPSLFDAEAVQHG